MLAAERRKTILEELKKNKKVIVSELSRTFGVSEETIRRDLEKLEREGLAVKSYGGATLNETANVDLPFRVRKNENILEKQCIAQLVENLVNDGDTLMLDASSTVGFIARQLKKKKNLVVITNSIEIVIDAMKWKEWQVLSTGGNVSEGSYAMSGEQTDRMLEQYYVDYAIISCKGIDMEYGVMDADEAHARNKDTMRRRARRKILAIDHTKFGRKAFTRVCGFDGIEVIVTDQKPDEEWLELFEKCKVACIYPED